MKGNRNTRQHYLLAGSLVIWLLCAWVAQQPVPGRKMQPKSVGTKRTPVPAAKSPASQSGKTATSSAVTATTTTAGKSGEVRHDPESGLAIDETMPIVKGQCTACHSSKLILQSHFDRDKWIERIRWMQRTQKLWDLGDTEKPILAYLTKYYGPLEAPFDGRRLPLSPQTWHSQ